MNNVIKPINKIPLVFLFCITVLSSLTYAQEKGNHVPVNISLVYPISINRTPYDRVNIGLLEKDKTGLKSK